MKVCFVLAAGMTVAALLWLSALTGQSQEAELEWIQGQISFAEYRQAEHEMMNPIYFIVAAMIPFMIGLSLYVKKD